MASVRTIIDLLMEHRGGGNFQTPIHFTLPENIPYVIEAMQEGYVTLENYSPEYWIAGNEFTRKQHPITVRLTSEGILVRGKL